MNAVIEIPKGSFWKYEITNSSLILDRMLNQPCPYNYGFLPDSPIQEDGDKLDVFVLSDHPIFPLTKLEVDVIGLYRCIDNGAKDDKVVAVVKGSKLEHSFRRNIEHYLSTYKKGFEILSFETMTSKEFQSAND